MCDISSDVLFSGSPKPIIINEFRYYVHKGQPAMLIMNTNGCPSVRYTWTHKGIVLPQNRHVDGHWHSTVNISHTREEDFGIYQLNMSNPYGNYVQQYELIHAGITNNWVESGNFGHQVNSYGDLV